MFGLMVSEPAVCTESGWERFLGIFKELCCTAESCFLGPALQWKCYCSRTLKHVRPSGAQQGLWSQTLFSSPMLRLPSLTFLGISEEFCSQFLIKSLQGNSGSCSCLQTGLSVTSIQQHILQIFQYLPKWIVIYLRVVKKTKNKSSLLIWQRHADHLMCLQKICWSSPWQQRRRTASCASWGQPKSSTTLWR